MNACTAFASDIDDAALGAPSSAALTAHLSTCAACAAQLEQRRLLAQRIDRTVGAFVRAEPAPGLSERIAARVPKQRTRSWRPIWLGVPAALALAAGLLVFIVARGGGHGAAPATTIATLTAWRSPTASLLVNRGDVLGAPFTTYRRSWN